MAKSKNQEARVTDTKLTVLVDSEPGALAVEKTLSEAESPSRIRVLRECNRAAANAENLVVFSAASRLEHVAECVSVANKAHRLTALLVHNDLAANWLPFVFHQSGLRTLRNMMVHTDPDLPTRILNAWSIGGEHDFIADAAVIKDRLFVRSCAFEAYSLPFDAFPALQRIPNADRSSFVLEENGLLLYWPEFQVHLDLEDIRFANDPKRQQLVRLARFADQRDMGAALRQVREAVGLTQSDIKGISERQVRRVESGDRLTTDTLDAFAAAMSIHPNQLLERLSEMITARDEPDERFASPFDDKSDTVVHNAVHEVTRSPSAREWYGQRNESTAENLRLAADSSEHTPAQPWDLKVPNGGSLRGSIEHDFRTDELVFVITEVQNMEANSPPVSIVTWSSRTTEPLISHPFVPAVGARISLGVGQAIVPRDVSRVEVRIVNES